MKHTYILKSLSTKTDLGGHTEGAGFMGLYVCYGVLCDNIRPRSHSEGVTSPASKGEAAVDESMTFLSGNRRGGGIYIVGKRVGGQF